MTKPQRPRNLEPLEGRLDHFWALQVTEVIVRLTKVEETLLQGLHRRLNFPDRVVLLKVMHLVSQYIFILLSVQPPGEVFISQLIILRYVHLDSLLISDIFHNFSLQRGSPTSNECDFHCCSLHASSSHKTVATSPIGAAQQPEVAGTQDGKRSLPKGAHVRFSEVQQDGNVAKAGPAGT